MGAVCVSCTQYQHEPLPQVQTMLQVLCKETELAELELKVGTPPAIQLSSD